MFTVPLTSKLSGATVSQLAHWRRTEVLIPEVKSSGRPLLYSFRDIYALRSFAKLRQEASLQQIRKALAHARDDMAVFQHPSEFRLVKDGDSIVLVREEHGVVDVLKHPGQTLIATFEEVFAEFTNIAGQRVVDLRRPARHLEVEPARLGGWPTIEGTRVPYDAVADLLADGSMQPGDVNYYYPSVSTEAAVSALEFARELETIAA